MHLLCIKRGLQKLACWCAHAIRVSRKPPDFSIKFACAWEAGRGPQWEAACTAATAAMVASMPSSDTWWCTTARNRPGAVLMTRMPALPSCPTKVTAKGGGRGGQYTGAGATTGAGAGTVGEKCLRQRTHVRPKRCRVHVHKHDVGFHKGGQGQPWHTSKGLGQAGGVRVVPRQCLVTGEPAQHGATV
jgi:hypothetical protein